MFSRIARRYDLMNRVMTFGMDLRWRRVAGKKLALVDGGRLLDVATGTGDFATALKGLYPGSNVVGLDFSEGMLEVALPKVRRSRGIRLVQADGNRLPFPKNTFEGAVSGFALRNVPDIALFLDEMQRVVKPGRSIVILEIAWPTLRGFRRLYEAYFGWLVPRIGSWLSGDSIAYGYLPESVRQFAKPAELAGMFRKIGLHAVGTKRLGFGSIIVIWGTKPPTHVRQRRAEATPFYGAKP
jgi:demethylmenaquinone methyltransferase/2-methoxy-6-polyprenyl-1,4-benzoquinol methylase